MQDQSWSGTAAHGRSIRNSVGNGPLSQRVLSVDEALQYSAFSATTSYGRDCITLPQVGRSGPSSLLSSFNGTKSKQALKDLNLEIKNKDQDTKSVYLDTAVKEVQRLLKADSLSEFKFKRPSSSVGSSDTAAAANGLQGSNFNLSPFAKMVLRKTDVEFLQKSTAKPVSKMPKKPSSHLTPPSAPNGDSYHEVNRYAVSQNAFPSLDYASTESKKLQPMVVIHRSSSSSQHDHVGTPDQPPAGTGLKPVVEIPRSSIARTHDRQAEADEALASFVDYLQDLFDAENQLPSESSVDPFADLGPFFVMMNASESSPFAIAPTVHSKIQNQIQKLVGLGIFGDVPVQDLIHLQKLCEPVLMAARTIHLKLDSEASDTDVMDWLQKIELAEHGLRSAGTLIRLMSTNRDEKELRSEEHVLAIPKVLSNVFENSIIPAVECRSQNKGLEMFALLSNHKKELGDLMQRAKKTLTQFSNLVTKSEVVEQAITTIEYLAAKLFFVENAHSEKEAILGTAKFEAVRRCAMEALAKIFSSYEEQRPSILDEILNSLEKLPQTQKNARQYKLIDGKPIQLLTALVMQLVQRTTLQSEPFSSRKKRRIPEADASLNDDSMMADEDAEGNDDDGASAHGSNPFGQALEAQIKSLYKNATASAQYVVKYFVTRAMSASKTGDQPYRNLFDLFVEDLISVLNSTDWPAAEIILHLLASYMVKLASVEKSTALAKNMALEVLGWMGAAISDSILTLRRFNTILDKTSSNVSAYLHRTIDSHLQSTSNIEDVVDPEGPFRIALEYLHERSVTDWQLLSAESFYLVRWAKIVSNRLESGDNDAEAQSALEVVSQFLVKMLADRKWIENEGQFASVATTEGRAAYNLTILNMEFCNDYNAIVTVLLSSLSSDQIKIRNRSLKSVVTMLEKDPTLLDRQKDIMHVIFRCASDQSPMVRDSALSLIGKCILLKPGLESEASRVIIKCTADQAPGVRKRSIALLKDMYSRKPGLDSRAAIAESILLRIQDPEDSICDLSRQTIEELWIDSFSESIDKLDDLPKVKVAFREHVAVIVKCVQQGGDIVSCFENFLKKILVSSHKNFTANTKVCAAIVRTLFDALSESVDTKDWAQDSIEESQFPGGLAKHFILQTITILAMADAKLFSPVQLEPLIAYTENLSTQDDLFLFRSTVIIFRCVLPSFSAAHATFLKQVQTNLLRCSTRLQRAELNEAIVCVSALTRVLKNPEKVAGTVKGILVNIYKDRERASQNPKMMSALVRLLGAFGKYCDMEDQSALFKSALSWWKGISVAGLLVDTLLPFLKPSQPQLLKTVSLESLVSICQSWPALFSNISVQKVLDIVFREDDANLQNIVLKTFSEFFTINEGKAPKMANFDGTDITSSSRFGASLKASDTDGAVSMIAQHYLNPVIRISLSRQDQIGLTAVDVIASISRQGLALPKECAVVWVAAETSSNQQIAAIAYKTHKELHPQHESIFEREYMRAIHGAYLYQRTVVGDCSGATRHPFRAKLSPLFEVVKTSNSKYQKKFLSNMCSKIDFDLEKLDCSGELPDHLLFARFLVQNLAFFEYGKLEELLHAISCMEKIVHETGTSVAHAIDTELFKSTIEQDAIQREGQQCQTESTVPAAIDPSRLKLLTTSSMILCMLWEARTFLRRVYGVTSVMMQREKKGHPKDMTKAPTKVHGIGGDRFWEPLSRIMGALATEETMVLQCQDLSRLMSIDDEVKVVAEDDLEGMSYESESLDLEDVNAVSGPGKRKSSISVSGTPKKPRKRVRPSLGDKRKSSSTFNYDANGWD